MSLSTTFHLMYFNRKYLSCPPPRFSFCHWVPQTRCVFFLICYSFLSFFFLSFFLLLSFFKYSSTTQHLIRRFYPWFYCFVFCKLLAIISHRQWFLAVKYTHTSDLNQMIRDTRSDWSASKQWIISTGALRNSESFRLERFETVNHFATLYSEFLKAPCSLLALNNRGN